ncbi:hypothetical protein ASO20_01025 [Mycoplasma sp. (ex Biomphalaria glabrata)]|uniref:HAD family hydrolase n=1 Tax=Mycoplasma sp. (ex Biomphalaria glabrata) TaxID=1749074 RepID=UPI00073A7BBE|nr:Cof-type HAD-IIB family hydrolase [Mycoplasma sp. (ex Biomphalaria glabrata)]ALV23241.1 hypothetical protein ASO20_01025 [Mycoplasma sp. (ex Biomphalaria glabrata)]
MLSKLHQKIQDQKIKLLCLDLDGTLLFNRHLLSRKNHVACIAAQKEGIEIILSTGRDLQGALPVARNILINKNQGYVVSLNGAKIYDIRKREVIYSNLIPEKLMKEAIQYLQSNGWKFLVYTTSGPYSNISSWIAKIVASQINEKIAKTSDMKKFQNSCYKIIAIYTKGFIKKKELKTKTKELVEKFSGKLEVAPTHNLSIEITNLNVNKGEAVKWLAAKKDILMEEVAAIGDGWNDLPLLKVSGVSIAMGNAITELKKVAKFTTGTNKESGVADAINKYVLTEKIEFSDTKEFEGITQKKKN